MKVRDSGQVVVEYLLLIVAVVSIMFGVFEILKTRISADPNACRNGSINPLCYLQTLGLESNTDVRSNKFRNYKL